MKSLNKTNNLWTNMQVEELENREEYSVMAHMPNTNDVVAPIECCNFCCLQVDCCNFCCIQM